MDSQGSTTHTSSSSSFGGNSSKTESRSWANYTEQYKQHYDNASPKVPMLYTTNFALSLVAMVLAILAMVLLVLKRSPKLLAVMLVIGGVLGIVAIGMMAGLHPQYVRDDSHATSIPSDGPGHSFMGTNSTSSGGVGYNYSWGPGIGWYMSLVGSILMFISAALVFIRKSRGAPAGPPQPYPAQLYQPPPLPPPPLGYPQQPYPSQPAQPESYPPQPGPPQQYYAPPPLPPQQQPYGQPPGPPYNNPPLQ
jgi:hypothetical protein